MRFHRASEAVDQGLHILGKQSKLNIMSVGVIIARLQPIHNGHLELIKQALNENEKVVLFIGSADKVNERNPIPIKLRLYLTRQAIDETFDAKDAKRIEVIPLDDLSDETENNHDWGFYLYAHIVLYTLSPTFTIYYSDGFEIIMKWFPAFASRDFISYKLNARGAMFNGLSATKVRVLILQQDYEELKKYVPKVVMDNVDIIRHYISVIE